MPEFVSFIGGSVLSVFLMRKSEPAEEVKSERVFE